MASCDQIGDYHWLNGMVWYGMVWYGMVWYGMVWYGMVWYGMVLCSTVGYGKV
jgi:chloride channel 2